MRSVAFCILGFLTACGGDPFLEAGDYDVSSFFVHDDFLSQAGKESTTIWTLEEDNGNYTVTVMGGTKDARGTVEGDSLVIFKEEEVECGGKTTYSATVSPLDGSSSEFTGTATLVIDLCFLDEEDSLLVEAHLVGEKR